MYTSVKMSMSQEHLYIPLKPKRIPRNRMKIDYAFVDKTKHFHKHPDAKYRKKGNVFICYFDKFHHQPNLVPSVHIDPFFSVHGSKKHDHRNEKFAKIYLGNKRTIHVGNRTYSVSIFSAPDNRWKLVVRQVKNDRPPSFQRIPIPHPPRH